LLVSIGMSSAQDDNTLIMARAVDATGLDPHTQTAFASLRLLEQHQSHKTYNHN